MSSHPGSAKPDIGIVIAPSPDQLAAARTYITSQHFEDETQILDMLGLDGAA